MCINQYFYMYQIEMLNYVFVTTQTLVNGGLPIKKVL